jgi:hypothetical protein
MDHFYPSRAGFYPSRDQLKTIRGVGIVGYESARTVNVDSEARDRAHRPRGHLRMHIDLYVMRVLQGVDFPSAGTPLIEGTVFSKRIESLWHELRIGGDLDGVSSARDLWCLLADLGIDAEQSGTGLSAAFDAAGAFSGAAAWTVLTTAESLPVGVVEKTLDVLLDYSSQWADFLATHWPIVIENWDDAATLMIDIEMNLFALPPELFDFAVTALDGASDIFDALLNGHDTADILMHVVEGAADSWDGLATAGAGIALSIGVGKFIDSITDEKLAPLRTKLIALTEAKQLRETVARKLKAGLPPPVIAPDLGRLHTRHWGL